MGDTRFSFDCVNAQRNKRGITLDEAALGVAVLKKLVETADVVVEIYARSSPPSARPVPIANGRGSI
jgi:hypothetical protein